MENFFEFYKQCMETGHIIRGEGGLCSAVSGTDLISPTRERNPEYYEGNVTGGYWGYDGEPLSSGFSNMGHHLAKRNITDNEARYAFTPFRQTVVLLLAAMGGQIP